MLKIRAKRDVLSKDSKLMPMKNRQMKQRKIFHLPIFHSSPRGQIEGFDVVLSIFIFLLLFGFAAEMWQDIFFGSVGARKLERLKLKAVELSDQLVLSQGSPAGWENLSDYNKIGLVASYRKISQGKLDKFRNADYNAMKTKMNIEGNEYFVSIATDQNVVFTKGIMSQSDFSVKVERIVLYRNTPSLLSVILHG